MSNKPFVLDSLHDLEMLRALPEEEVEEFPPGIVRKAGSHQCNYLEKPLLSSINAGQQPLRIYL